MGYFFTLLLAAILFLLLRPVFLWYCKVNERLESQRAILAELRKMNDPAAPPQPEKEAVHKKSYVAELFKK